MFVRIRGVLDAVRGFIKSRVMNSACVLSFALLASQTSSAATESATGIMGDYRLYTVHYSTSDTHDVSIFQLTTPMANDCHWVWVEPSEKNALAFALAAKATGATI